MIIFDVLPPTLGSTLDDYCRLSTAEPPTARRVPTDRYRDYRAAFPHSAIVCPADVLRHPDIAAAVRKREQSVAVQSCGELDVVLSAGVPAARIVVHDDGVTAAPIRRSVTAGVGRLVIRCCRQVPVLAACDGRFPHVLVDVSTDCADETIAAVLAHPGLDLIGLHARLAPDAHRMAYARSAAQMIAHMAHIHREHGTIATRVSLTGGEIPSDGPAAKVVLCGLAAELEDALDEACARYRFPRPALVLTPRAS